MWRAPLHRYAASVARAWSVRRERRVSQAGTAADSSRRNRMTHLVRWAHRLRVTHSRRAVLALTTLGLSIALVAAFLAVGPTFAAPPSSSITLSPSAAIPGANVTVSGANFNCKSVDLAFDGASVGTASPTKKAFSASITVPSDAFPGGPALHTMTASCAGQKSDKSAAQASFTVLAPTADLQVVMTDQVILPVMYHQVGLCAVTVSNLGPNIASNVAVRFSTSPSIGLDFVVVGGTAGGYDPTTQQWAIGSMFPNAHETLDCHVAGLESVSPNQVFHTTAVVSSDTADPVAADNTAVMTTTFE
jgi:hypothetical protein